MPDSQRRANFYCVTDTTVSKSWRFTPGSIDYGYPDAVARIERGLIQHHRDLTPDPGEGAQADPGATEVIDVEHGDGWSLLVIRHGNDKGPLPGLAAPGEEHETPTPRDGQKKIHTCHVLLGTHPRRDGSYPAVIEYVPFVSRSRIESFLNHLFYAERSIRHPTGLGYMVYSKVRFEAETEHELGEILARSAGEVFLDVRIPRWNIDSVGDDAFTVTYERKASTLDQLRASMPAITQWGLRLPGSKVRVRGKVAGQKFKCGWTQLIAEYEELRLTRHAAIVFDPPVNDNYRSIDNRVRRQLLALMQVARE